MKIFIRHFPRKEVQAVSKLDGASLSADDEVSGECGRGQHSFSLCSSTEAGNEILSPKSSGEFSM